MTRSIAIIVEGATERAFKKPLEDFLASRLTSEQKPRLKFISEDGRIPQGDMLRRDVKRLLEAYDAVIALTDVYTGSNPRDFEDAGDAKNKMSQWVGSQSGFFAHAAQYEFEAWLLPYRERIRKLSGTNRQTPSRNPETVNHNKPPSDHLNDAYRQGKKRAYRKVIDGTLILRDQNLADSAAVCPEPKEFLNTTLGLSGGSPL